jgi:DNA-binding transcriptional ArsR family regulator
LTFSAASAILNHMVHYKGSAKLDAVLAAIADPTRRAIVNRLSRGSARVSDVAQRFPMSLTGFIKHVKILESAGLVSRQKTGRENTIELNAEPLRHVARWTLNYAQFWNSRLDRFEAFFAAKERT